MKPTRAPEDITQFQHWVHSFLLRRMTRRLTSRLKLTKKRERLNPSSFSASSEAWRFLAGCESLLRKG